MAVIDNVSVDDAGNNLGRVIRTVNANHVRILNLLGSVAVIELSRFLVC
jgi:hypothetical protein